MDSVWVVSGGKYVYITHKYIIDQLKRDGGMGVICRMHICCWLRFLLKEYIKCYRDRY